MKKLTAEEAKDLIPLKPGKHNWVYKHTMQLKVGEALIVRYEDWKTKNTPYTTFRTVAKNTGFVLDFGRMPDGSGWLVKRVK